MNTNAPAQNVPDNGEPVEENSRKFVRTVKAESGTTTIRVSKAAAKKWRVWCKFKNMSSEELMDRLIIEVGLKHQQKFYNSLPDPKVKTDKQLENIRLQKLYT